MTARLVVGRRPDQVAGDRVHPIDLDGGVGQRLVGQQRADLGDPGLDELAVVIAVAGERAHQRDALQAEQVGQRVLVDHPLDASHDGPIRRSGFSR
jgi:hypothetical protein